MVVRLAPLRLAAAPPIKMAGILACAAAWKMSRAGSRSRAGSVDMMVMKSLSLTVRSVERGKSEVIIVHLSIGDVVREAGGLLVAQKLRA